MWSFLRLIDSQAALFDRASGSDVRDDAVERQGAFDRKAQVTLRLRTARQGKEYSTDD